MTLWNATVEGPTSTPYEGGVFSLKIRIPPGYPIDPPEVRFVTRIYHPNVNSKGAVCADVLADRWSPALTIKQVLLAIRQLLAEPNGDDPLVQEIGDQLRMAPESYDETAREWTRRYAVGGGGQGDGGW